LLNGATPPSPYSVVDLLNSFGIEIVLPHFSESIAFWRIWAPLLALNFNCEPLFASVTAVAHRVSKGGLCNAFARTSHAAASASIIGRCRVRLPKFGINAIRSLHLGCRQWSSIAIALFIAACAAASLMVSQSAGLRWAFCGPARLIERR